MRTDNDFSVACQKLINELFQVPGALHWQPRACAVEKGPGPSRTANQALAPGKPEQAQPRPQEQAAGRSGFSWVSC